MSVGSTLTDVLTFVLTLLDRIHVAAEMDTDWLPIDLPVKV